jgi:hypothetical protein
MSQPNDEAIELLKEILDFIQGGLPKEYGGRDQYDLPADAANYLVGIKDRMETIIEKANKT